MAKKSKEKPIKKQKRILYPWLRRRQGRAFKAMLAVLADKEGFGDVIEGKTPINKFYSDICIKCDKIFPSMQMSLRTFYKKKGRAITKKEYRNIAIARLRMMFKFDKVKNRIIKRQEHPDIATVLAVPKKICKRILKRKITYDKYIKVKK